MEIKEKIDRKDKSIENATKIISKLSEEKTKKIEEIFRKAQERSLMNSLDKDDKLQVTNALESSLKEAEKDYEHDVRTLSKKTENEIGERDEMSESYQGNIKEQIKGLDNARNVNNAYGRSKLTEAMHGLEKTDAILKDKDKKVKMAKEQIRKDEMEFRTKLKELEAELGR